MPLSRRIAGEEEMFLILEGEGELRFGDQRFRSASTT